MASDKPQTQAIRRQSFKIEFDAVGQILVPILKRLNWRRLEIKNDAFRVSAIRSGSALRDSALKTFDYYLAISWARHPSGVEVLVTVSEPEFDWSQEECERRCEEIVDSITLRLAKL